MARLNLGALRGRVERLASMCPRSETFLIRWKNTDAQCPACGYDLGRVCSPPRAGSRN